MDALNPLTKVKIAVGMIRQPIFWLPGCTFPVFPRNELDSWAEMR